MADRLLSEEWWSEIAPFFPVYTPSPNGGRPPTPNRVVFFCILFVLKTGIAWEDLPIELGCSYKTCLRRLKLWIHIGLFEKIHHHLLTRLRAADRLEMSEVLVDAGLIKAPLGGRTPGQTPRIAGVVGAKST